LHVLPKDVFCLREFYKANQGKMDHHLKANFKSVDLAIVEIDCCVCVMADRLVALTRRAGIKDKPTMTRLVMVDLEKMFFMVV
jgi:hypothetical protein